MHDASRTTIHGADQVFEGIRAAMEANPRPAALFAPDRDAAGVVRAFRVAAANRRATRPDALRLQIGASEGAPSGARVAFVELLAEFRAVLETGEPLLRERQRCRVQADGSVGWRRLRLEVGRVGDWVLCAWTDLGADSVDQGDPRGRGSVEALLDGMDQLAWIRDPAGNMDWCNQRWCDFTGTTPEDMAGWGWVRVHHPDHLDRVVASLKQCLASGEPWDQTFPLRRADGVYRWFLTRAVPIRDEQGEIVRWIGTNTDVTEQRSAGEELREREARLRDSERFVRRVLDGLFTFVGVLETDGTVIEVNRAPLKAADIRDADVIGRRFWDCFWWSAEPPEVRRQLRDAIARACAGETVRYDVQVRMAGDRRMWIDFQIAPLCDDSGRVTHLIPSAIDLTERILAEEAVAEREERFRHLANAMPQLVWTADDAGEVDYYNEQFVRYGGIRRSDDGDWSWAPVVHPEDLETTLAAWQRAVATGESYQCEHRIRMRDGSARWHLSRAHRHRGRWFGTATDIHDIKLAEAELADAGRRKDEFLATLGHELRNPLAPIRAGIEILKLAGPDPALSERTLGVMERQTRQLTTLLDDLLDISRITRGDMQLHMQNLSVGEVLSAAVESAQHAIAERGHAFDFDPPREAWRIDGDVTRLVQVLTNLLGNAAKYTPHGGRVRLATRADGEMLVIAVEDDGIGIPSHETERIFEMFGRIDRPDVRCVGGLGIGLTLCRSLVELHRGTIRVHSEGEHRGSTFEVRLPLAGGGSRSAPVHAAGGAVLRRRLRILVVDDNVEAADMLATALRIQGDEVQVAHDGVDAVSVAADLRPDAVVMDLGMPRMDGFEAARRIRQQDSGRNALLIALSGWGREADRERARLAGFDHHLAKPAEPSTLEAIFAEVGRNPETNPGSAAAP